MKAITFSQLSDHALSLNASDIHLSSGMPAMVRVDGSMKEIRIGTLTNDEVKALIFGIMTPIQQETFISNFELDFSYETESKIRFRVNAFNTINGPAATLRLVPNKVITLSDLEAPAVLKSFTSLDKGLVLVTGPTGSGKSTTLAAMIDYINKSSYKHIITIEDPIEFVHKSDKCLVNQREVGSNTKSFANALKSALREDPDIILVGELRDLESIRLALTAAETGHLVFGTVHTSSAAQTINRIIDVFPGDDKDMVRTMLSSSLEGVIAQRLIPRATGKGRVAAYEIMVSTSAVKNLIRENKIPQIQSLIQVGSKDGMILMNDYVQNLILKGIVREEEGLLTTRNASESINASFGSGSRIQSSTSTSDENEF